MNPAKKYRHYFIGVVVLGLGFCCMLAAFQRQLLYFPSHESYEKLAINATLQGLQPWKNPSGECIGWEATASNARQIWLVFHGNAGCAMDRLYYVELLREVSPDSKILLFEYPGYGARAGIPSEKSFIAAAQAAIALLPHDAPLYVLGESLGSGVACQVAGAEPNRIHGLLLVTPFNNLTEVAAHHFPFLPVSWFLTERFPSDQALENYSGPIAIGLAGRDEVVPATSGRKLFAGYHGAKQLWEVPHARHNTVLHDEQWWRAAVRFLTTKQAP
jgi:pimeloyl-ACP methyl ester carboxylesterase